MRDLNMSDLDTTDTLFFTKAGLDLPKVEGLVSDALMGADDGELFLEYSQSESFVFDDGQLKSATFDEAQGFGLRSLAGEATGYAHAAELSEEAIKRAGQTVRAVHSGHSGTMALGPRGTNTALYDSLNPMNEMAFEAKVKLLAEIDAYARGKDDRIRQVSVSLSGSWQAVQILRAEGRRTADIRPLVRLNISIVVEQDGRMESGYEGAGGRGAYDAWIDPNNWRAQTDEALRQALVNLEAVPAPAGVMPVVLGPGWPGVLLHEAIGHGLEGDFNRKKTSAFSGLMGERIAAPGVTVVDDGTLPGRRGSLTIDDE
jgi:TldD protein